MKTTAVGSFDVPRRVLVCDDERHIVRILQVNLERQGHSVVCAYDGREALEFLQREAEPMFDAVLLDLMLPLVDGFDILRSIRSCDHTKDIWVALMVSRVSERDQQVLAPYRPDKYLVKPFAPASIFE